MHTDTILAVDLGESYLGFAIYSESLGYQPLNPIHIQSKYDARARIEQLLEDYQVRTMVVGDLGLGYLPKKWDRMLQEITKTKHVELKLIEERFTTFQANQDAIHQGVSVRDKSTHSQAAVNILRTFLDRNVKT